MAINNDGTSICEFICEWINAKIFYAAPFFCGKI